MKRTTYIIIGILAAGLLADAGYMAYISQNNLRVEIPVKTPGGPETELPIPACKHIELTSEPAEEHWSLQESQNKPYHRFKGFINITESDADSGTLTLTAEMKKYVLTRLTPDSVLQICFRFPADSLDQAMKGKASQAVIQLPAMCLRLPTGTQSIRNELSDVGLRLEGLRRDTLALSSHGNCILRQSKFGSLSIAGRETSSAFFMNSGEVKDLYVDLDNVFYWKTTPDSFHIDTEWLTGSYKHDCQWAKGESREIRWIPKTDEARLTLTLEQKAEIRACPDIPSRQVLKKE